MKSVIHTLLAIVGISSAFAGDIVVRSLPINSSFPNPDHVLTQELPKHDGKDVRVPYMICGVLPRDQVLKYADSTSGERKREELEARLPNGGIAKVAILKEFTFDGATQFDSKLQITGPGANTMETTVTTNDGDGILIRCDTNQKEEPQFVFLQIKKAN